MVIFGPPGCGKGTQSNRIISDFGLQYLSTGDFIREEIKSKTAVGNAFFNYISKGHLIPDEAIIEQVAKFIANNFHSRGIVFDGFPRTVYQAQMLDSFLAEEKYKIDLVIAIDVPDEELFCRIEERGKTSGRIDDDKTIMVQRLNVYRDQTQPVIDFYERKKCLHKIDGTQPVDAVYSNINLLITKTFKYGSK